MSQTEITEHLEALSHATHLLKQMVRELQGAQQDKGPRLLYSRSTFASWSELRATNTNRWQARNRSRFYARSRPAR